MLLLFLVVVVSSTKVWNEEKGYFDRNEMNSNKNIIVNDMIALSLGQYQ